MKLYYDFHIHTGLSPCGDSDMSPNNIVNMAVLNGLDAIAITDHNTCGNAAAVMEVAKDTELLVIPGMELETSEEAHVVCLFGEYEQAAAFSAIVESRMPKIKNRAEVFGSQLFFNAEDEAVAEYEHLLLNATTIDLSEAVELVKSYGGVAIPAHVDRGSYSIISNLGFIPPELDIKNIEISKAIQPAVFFEQFSRSLLKDYSYIRSSDAHYLGDINERINYMEFNKDRVTAADVVERLRA